MITDVSSQFLSFLFIFLFFFFIFKNLKMLFVIVLASISLSYTYIYINNSIGNCFIGKFKNYIRTHTHTHGKCSQSNKYWSISHVKNICFIIRVMLCFFFFLLFLKQWLLQRRAYKELLLFIRFKNYLVKDKQSTNFSSMKEENRHKMQ